MVEDLVGVLSLEGVGWGEREGGPPPWDVMGVDSGGDQVQIGVRKSIVAALRRCRAESRCLRIQRVLEPCDNLRRELSPLTSIIQPWSSSFL